MGVVKTLKLELKGWVRIGTTVFSGTCAACPRVYGYVGIGTTAPVAKFQVSGQAATVLVSGSSLAVDFNSGNIQSTSASAGTLVLSNMIDGAKAKSFCCPP